VSADQGGEGENRVHKSQNQKKPFRRSSVIWLGNRKKKARENDHEMVETSLPQTFRLSRGKRGKGGKKGRGPAISITLPYHVKTEEERGKERKSVLPHFVSRLSTEKRRGKEGENGTIRVGPGFVMHEGQGGGGEKRRRRQIRTAAACHLDDVVNVFDCSLEGR